jgi:hypothetical protein
MVMLTRGVCRAIPRFFAIALAEVTPPLARRPRPPWFSLAKTKIVSPLAGFSGVVPWTEPGAADFFNIVQGKTDSNGMFDRISITSDFASPGMLGLPDGMTDTTSFTLNGIALSVTFFDKGDVATAPDTGSTLGLLSLSVVALLGATRLRFLQLAA